MPAWRLAGISRQQTDGTRADRRASQAECPLLAQSGHMKFPHSASQFPVASTKSRVRPVRKVQSTVRSLPRQPSSFVNVDIFRPTKIDALFPELRSAIWRSEHQKSSKLSTHWPRLPRSLWVRVLNFRPSARDLSGARFEWTRDSFRAGWIEPRSAIFSSIPATPRSLA